VSPQFFAGGSIIGREIDGVLIHCESRWATRATGGLDV
jgi:hypothetical protein